MTLSIHSPDELIAAIPHLLGFKAEESIVFVPLRADLPLARVDLPTLPANATRPGAPSAERSVATPNPVPVSPSSA